MAKKRKLQRAHTFWTEHFHDFNSCRRVFLVLLHLLQRGIAAQRLQETVGLRGGGGFIVGYRRLITSGESKPREEATPIHIADIARMTAALQSSPIDDSVSPAASTPRSNTPGVPPQGNLSLDHDRRLVVPEEVPLPSSFVPGWNEKARHEHTGRQSTPISGIRTPDQSPVRVPDAPRERRT